MKQRKIELNRPWEATNSVEQARASLALYYLPEEPEVGMTLTTCTSNGLYTSLNLTYQETLALARALRQIPEIEQATVPETISREQSEKVGQPT